MLCVSVCVCVCVCVFVCVHRPTLVKLVTEFNLSCLSRVSVKEIFPKRTNGT